MVGLCSHFQFFPQAKVILHKSFDQGQYYAKIMPEISLTKLGC